MRKTLPRLVVVHVDRTSEAEAAQFPDRHHVGVARHKIQAQVRRRDKAIGFQLAQAQRKRRLCDFAELLARRLRGDARLCSAEMPSGRDGI